MEHDLNEIIEIIDDAWEYLEMGDFAKSTELARVALAIQPEAIDALVVLSQTCGVATEAIALLREAVRIGNRAFNRSRKFDYGNRFYDRRAHARASGNLARLFWAAECESFRVEAVKEARRALRLDPNDSAGNRLLLMSWEATTGNWDAARRVAHKYRDEGRTEVRYWLALHAFRDGADNADQLLALALNANPHVAAALNGKIQLMRLPEHHYPLGSPAEAAIYATDARAAWEATPGALDWLSQSSI